MQLLKSAIKIQQDQDEARLTDLVEKWRGAGRDAALQLWQIVKDRSPEDISHNEVRVGWGWHESERHATEDSFQKNHSWGWDTSDRWLGETDSSVCTSPSPAELESELYASLKKKTATKRKTLLPPTQRGGYYEQRLGVQTNTVTENSSFEAVCSRSSSGMQNTLGNMLLRLGVAHEILGWLPEEDDFVDVQVDV